MLKFVAKQLTGLVMTVVVASFVVYSSMYLSPGGPESVLFGNRQPSEEVRRAVRHHLGLDEPFLPRYFHWLGSVLSGDLGTSLVSQQPVGDRIGHPFLVTLGLVAYASVLVVVLGVGLGLAAALWPGPVDGAVTGIVSVATALPAFVASSLAISLFAVRLHWFPGYGADPGAAGWLLLVTSVSQKDFPVVQAITLVIVIAFVTVNLITEVIGAALDPRIRVAS